MFDYYRTLIGTAVRHSVHLTHGIVAFAIVVLGALPHLFPAISFLPKLDEWAIISLAFAGAIVVRLILAPYWIWDEQRQQISGLESQIAELKMVAPQGTPEIILYVATEKDSHVIPLGENKFNVMFRHPLRCTPTIKFREPDPKTFATQTLMEYWTPMGFTVTFPRSAGEVRTLRFEANAHPLGA
ncbi:MAG TPA: hypothetical protein VLX09_13445 [Stellaceae bacterium]|nr:hypothetical protein [Stellaceae bacterium]